MKALPPTNFASAPAMRFSGGHQLSPIEVGPGGSVFFATHVPAINASQPPHVVPHPMHSFAVCFLVMAFYKRNGRLPW